MTQTPLPSAYLLKWRGDALVVELRLDRPRKGRAALRTNLGHAGIRRQEIIAETERGEVPLARAWTDLPLEEVAPGVFRGVFRLDEIGVFSAKACFFPEGSELPEWPEGENFHVKVESDAVRRNNSIYTVFPRQFGSFREVARRLDHIMGRLGFRILQTLPPFPVPTTYAVMGEYGCPFAATDFLSVDPAMAEFDEFATPLDQFLELIDAVHARDGLFFVDLPANHTGWASTLQTHHPDWFRREPDGRFHSPGAWGVKWADLVELDYTKSELRTYMAEVFLFWCRKGVDGFRCDAGYMIPLKTWEYIVARVREEFPDTVFMLEGLGGDLKVTDDLLAVANLDWAYSEIFQTYDRSQFEWYLPGAIVRSERFGALVHFAETHDNDRLAKGGETYARLRVQLAALLSWQGAWGIANGVEWLACEKIDVHGRNDLNWGAHPNMLDLIADLNRTLREDPSFSGPVKLRLVTRGEGNTLAVVREAETGEKSLVLANFDCSHDALVDWDHADFAGDGEPVRLGPGEVRYLRGERAEHPFCERYEAPAEVPPEPLFRLSFPRDVRREVVLPAGSPVVLSAASPFRACLVDPRTERTLRACRAHVVSEGVYEARLVAPAYEGDGTTCRRLVLKTVVYAPSRAERLESSVLIPPSADAARAKLAMTGEEVRAFPACRTILSNGAGAAAQLRAGWGLLASQYDAILAANPNPTCPSDRQVLWTRTRCWLQREGYTREFDARCMTRFAVDPAGRAARWEFRVPCGMGRTASFAFEISLALGANAARLKVERLLAEGDDVGTSVRLVFRPDIENRSFHATTKAYLLENAFASPLVFHLTNCALHPEPEWSYNIPHPEEAARGQEPCGDLYSPGWISADLCPGETCEILGSAAPSGEKLAGEPVCLEGEGLSSVPEALRRALDLYIVRRDDLKTVIAGYPWFLDWGRDTFIFMRGMIAAGRFDDAFRILKAFAAFEENGTLPNIIYGKTAGNRDTTDAPLWFIRCVQELSACSEAPACDGLLKTCASIVDNYLAGTPNGIRVDPDSSLVWSPSHFTWMDTNYPACTPRAGYPIEIQALWISALRFLGRKELAAHALASVRAYFHLPAPALGYADCLDAPSGESAAEARPDAAVRPNQLFLVTLGILDDPSILRATEELLVPGGVRSLNAADPRYRGSYAGDEDTCRKPAYHNGTVWAWPFPLYAEALAMLRPEARAWARDLLAGAVENLNAGCLAHLSENADGDAPHAQKGCTAQAWSDSELLRVWLKLGKE